MRTRLLACALLLSACQSQPNPAAGLAKSDLLAIDPSWWRIAPRTSLDSSGGYGDWVASHPRLDAVAPELRARLTETARAISRRPGLGTHAPIAGTLATGFNWRLDQTSPISTTAAVIVLGATMDGANDRVVIEGGGAGTPGDPTHYIGVLSNIYTATPTVTKSPALDSVIDGSALNTSADSTLVYAVTSGGGVYAVKVADATFAWQKVVPAGVSWSTPWYESSNNFLYVADTAGNVTAFNAITGAQQFQVLQIAGAGVAIHSSPVMFNGSVWVGADDGKLYRLDPSTGAAQGMPTDLCLTTGSCTSFDQIWSGASIDPTNNKLLIGVNKRINQIDLTACTAMSATCTATGFSIDDAGFTSPNGRFYSSPVIDATTNFAYFGFANRLWRAPYSNGISGAMSRATTSDATGLLRGVNPSDNGYPKGLVIPFNGQAFVGDGGGFIHRFNINTFAETALQSYANAGAGSPGPTGPSIDSTPLVDVTGGNIYFGVKNPNAPLGSWVSLPQTFASDAVVPPGSTTHLRLSASASVAAGAAVPVTITALDASNNTATGYLGTVHIVSSDGAAMLPADQTFVAGDMGVRTVMVTFNTAGTQTITGIDTQIVSNNIFGATAVCVGAGPCTTKVSTDRLAYSPSDPVVVSYGGMAGNNTDWIAVATQGASDMNYSQFQYTTGSTSGAVAFTIATAGTYVARAYFNNGFTRQAESPAFTVGGTSVMTDKAAYNYGDPIVVTWAGLPGNQFDWVSIAPSGSPDTTYTDFVYTNGQKSGTATFRGIHAGTWVARAYFNNNFVKQAESAPFTVTGTTTCSPAQMTFAPGQPVVINFTGMSGDMKDWIGISVPGSGNTSYLSFRYTGGAVNGSVSFVGTSFPPGTYEARAFFKDSFNLEATSMTFVVQ